MKKKTIIIIISIIVLIGVGLAAFAYTVKEDQRKTIIKMEEINDNYDKYNQSIQAFAKIREQYFEAKADTFLEEFSKNTKDWNTLMDSYEKSVQKIEDRSKNLKKNCVVKFADAGVNNKCTMFKANYEAAMNYYITDVKNYNKTVDEYNTWVTEGNYKYDKLNLVVYQDYTDFDKDGEYFGKEENND